MKIGNRVVDKHQKPFVIPEIGINHNGDIAKAKQMVRDAKNAGAECAKFQCHVIDDEMIPNEVVPSNAKESIWKIMSKAALSENEERELKDYVEELGLLYLSTPFSRAAADRLENFGVKAYKIGSGECNNYPLIDHIASFGKPIILSTGMNNVESIAKAVALMERRKVEYALLHCTSMYPTPYEKVRLGALEDLSKHFPNAVLGLSDHSLGNYTCFGAIPLGARILEKHFTSSLDWDGPDVPISITPDGLRDLIVGSEAIFQSLGGNKTILAEEKPTIDFAYACVVTITPVKKGEIFSSKNIWVKRPGTGEILAESFESLLGKVANEDLPMNTQLRWNHVNR